MYRLYSKIKKILNVSFVRNIPTWSEDGGGFNLWSNILKRKLIIDSRSLHWTCNRKMNIIKKGIYLLTKINHSQNKKYILQGSNFLTFLLLNFM